MSATTVPTIPPRPARAQQAAAANGANKLPEIPPRPLPKRLDRSVSPGNFPRSPLNEPWQPLTKIKSTDANNGTLRRPSVQQMPSVGQEGMEYADIDTPNGQNIPTEQTRSVAQDLHLHAPKPSLPKASATAQVQAVTRTDSGVAAGHGVGKSGTPGADEGEHMGRVRSRASFSRPGSSASGNRRLSMHADEHGPAEIGMRVPINPLLGDVQAPSPAPFTPSHTGEKRRGHHNRARSRDGLPPGSYGLHGHGIASSDPFEKDWYAKHPEELQHEEAHGHGVYEGIGSGRGAFALSSDDLNKIVRNTASRGSGFGRLISKELMCKLTITGTTGNTLSYPDEQIGYLASEHYQGHPLTKSLTNVSQPAHESPLRKSSLPASDMDPVVSFSKRQASNASESAMDSPLQTPVHIEAPENRYNKITGGEETINESADLGPSISRPGTGHGDSDYNAPILAADEVAKNIMGEHLHPAISPRVDRRSSDFADYRSGEITPTSRPSSRPGSIHGMHSGAFSLGRFASHHDDRESMHTPLEDVDEYEPLFPDEDSKLQKSVSHVERFKQRPDALKHRFPSNDIWEDARDYGMYEATVSTPEPPHEQEIRPSSGSTFETPEQEAAGKGEKLEADRKRKLAQRALLPSHLQDEIPTRPGMQPRFPSQDIWEDSPDSFHLVTTVSSPPPEDTTSPVEAPAPRPMIPPRPAQKSKLADGPSAAQAPPVIPARPTRKPDITEGSPTELKKVPSIPDRPKPQVPPRPAKKPSGDSLTKTLSDQSTETERAVPQASPPLTKAKPQIPARPGPSAKFTGLKGNFMSDLNQKLGLGPPKEKEPEPEAEAKPLEDARKSRARGPQRRAPAKSPSGLASSPPAKVRFATSKPLTVWHIDDSGRLNVPSSDDGAKISPSKALESEAEKLVTPEQSEVLQNATIADAGSPPTIDTSTERQAPEETIVGPDHQASHSVPAPEAPSEYAEPTPGTPVSEKPNPLSHQATNDAAYLSQQTTASSGLASGPELEKIQTPIRINDVPAVTADANVTSPERKAAEEPIELRNEQVSAAAPSSSSLSAVPDQNPDGTSTVNSQQAGVAASGQQDAATVAANGVVAGGADHAAEPMPEKDVSYDQLEAMQMKADGKELSDGEMKKVME